MLQTQSSLVKLLIRPDAAGDAGPVLVIDAPSLRGNPEETLALVHHAAQTIEALQVHTHVVADRARTLLHHTKEERSQIKAELCAAQEEAALWRQRALRAEADLEAVEEMLQAEFLKRQEAESREFQAFAALSACDAERRDLETTLERIIENLEGIADA
jgi:hypothetical protein